MFTELDDTDNACNCKFNYELVADINKESIILITKALDFDGSSSDCSQILEWTGTPPEGIECEVHMPHHEYVMINGKNTFVNELKIEIEGVKRETFLSLAA